MKMRSKKKEKTNRMENKRQIHRKKIEEELEKNGKNEGN